MRSEQASPQLSRRAACAVGLIVVAVGLIIVGVGSGVISVPPDKLRAPGWVIASVGAAFSLAGIVLALPPTFLRLQAFLGALLVSTLCLAPSWVAFGSGPREFSGSFSLGFFARQTSPSASGGRIAFGAGAVFTALFAIWAWIRWFRLQFLRERGHESGRS